MKCLRILQLEDDAIDIELVQRGLKRLDIDGHWRTVSTKAEFLAAQDADRHRDREQLEKRGARLRDEGGHHRQLDRAIAAGGVAFIGGNRGLHGEDGRHPEAPAR